MHFPVVIICFCEIISTISALAPIESYNVKYKFQYYGSIIQELCETSTTSRNIIELRRHQNSIAFKLDGRYRCGKINIHDREAAEILTLGNDGKGNTRTAVRIKSFPKEYLRDDKFNLITYDLKPYLKYFNAMRDVSEGSQILYEEIRFVHGICNSTVNITTSKGRVFVNIEAISWSCQSFQHLDNDEDYKYCPYSDRDVVGIDANMQISYDKIKKIFDGIKVYIKINVLDDEKEVKEFVKDIAIMYRGTKPLRRDEDGYLELGEDIQWTSEKICF